MIRAQLLRQSEDCLYLNIYVPQSVIDRRASEQVLKKQGRPIFSSISYSISIHSYFCNNLCMCRGRNPPTKFYIYWLMKWPYNLFSNPHYVILTYMYLTPKSQKYNWMYCLQFHTLMEHYKQSMSIWGDLKKILKFSVKLPSFLQKEKRQGLWCYVLLKGQTKVQFVIHFYPSPPPP